MTGARSPVRRAALVAATAAALAMPVIGLALMARSQPPVAMINETASVPRGLYLRSADQALVPGRLVAVAQPPAARRYLAGLGVPPDMPLLKRIVAVGGEPVCAQTGQLLTPRGAVAIPAHDRRGVTLPVWRDCRRLAADELLLLGDTATSFDGRYFGPVRRADIAAVYTEVLQW